MNIGPRIREIRKEVGVSQCALARRAGMDPTALNKIERSGGNPRLSTLCSLALALNVSLVQLFSVEPCEEKSEGGAVAAYQYQGASLK